MLKRILSRQSCGTLAALLFGAGYGRDFAVPHGSGEYTHELNISPEISNTWLSMRLSAHRTAFAGRMLPFAMGGLPPKFPQHSTTLPARKPGRQS